MPLNPEDNKNSNLADTNFISEKIKQRPINRKKLLRRTLITVSLAVVFGIVACLTFLILQPVFSDKLYPESEPEAVSFPEETPSEELTPEEMFADDNQIAASEALSLEESQKDQIDQAIASYSFDSADYEKMILSLRNVTAQVEKHIVKLTAISNDSNWFTDSYETKGSTSGLIVADNGTNLYILVPSASVADAESIGITFSDGSTATSEISLIDTITGQCVLTVQRSQLSENTRQTISPAELDSSSLGSLTGSPVIAVGSPIGIQDSIAVGIVTSEKSPLNLVDSSYKLITTDIYGSSEATGVLINLKGQVIGIIDTSHNSTDMQNQICGIGITELKPLIEDLSNARPRPYLGIHGATVPLDIQNTQNLPSGAYITSTEMGSPAMKAGLQSGDIITSFNGYDINTYDHLITRLAGCSPDDIVSIKIMRQAPDEYIELEIEATMTSSTTK